MQNELRSKYNPDGSILRKAQLRMLDLLKFLDKICKENNIQYWLDSGTLLGAMRHGGFIPWDDDVDVCMMKEDAEKLKQIMEDKIWDGHVVLQTKDNDKHYYNISWMTLRDTKSEYLQDSFNHNRLKYRGMQVDIFVMEENANPTASKLGRFMNFGLIEAPLSNWHGLKFLRPFVPFNYQMVSKVIAPLLSCIPGRQNSLLSCGVGCLFPNIQKKSSVFPLSQVEFEGETFLAPANADEYLKAMFGNWNQVPSPDKIQTHNTQFKFYD